jgi:hypothetical protein
LSSCRCDSQMRKRVCQLSTRSGSSLSNRAPGPSSSR